MICPAIKRGANQTLVPRRGRGQRAYEAPTDGGRPPPGTSWLLANRPEGFHAVARPAAARRFLVCRLFEDKTPDVVRIFLNRATSTSAAVSGFCIQNESPPLSDVVAGKASRESTSHPPSADRSGIPLCGAVGFAARGMGGRVRLARWRSHRCDGSADESRARRYGARRT